MRDSVLLNFINLVMIIGSLVIGIMVLVWLLSRIQMKAWLKEFDSFLGTKLIEYINSKKKEKDGTEKKE